MAPPHTLAAGTRPAGRLDLEGPWGHSAAGRPAWTPPRPGYGGGYGWTYPRHVRQADQGCDFDFLETSFGAPVPEPAIY